MYVELNVRISKCMFYFYSVLLHENFNVINLIFGITIIFSIVKNVFWSLECRRPHFILLRLSEKGQSLHKKVCTAPRQ